MSAAAFALVLASACCHATWNLLLKRSTHKVAFLPAFGGVSVALFFVPAVVFAVVDGIDLAGVGFGLGSALIHGVYGYALARGYQHGDLSTVYPISRGLGPALIPIAAVLVLDESVSGGAAAGIGLVVAGIVVIQGEGFAPSELFRPLALMRRQEVRIALLTGVLIATYSVWDKASLDHLPPVTLNQFAMTGHMVLLLPIALRGSPSLYAQEWRERPLSIVAAGILAPLAYILVLVALTTTRISYVAPTREVGIVLGALLGVLLLHEGYGPFRIGGSALIVAGVFTLALAP
jgi:drug/metabolite transporter (DMT)-like permease